MSETILHKLTLIDVTNLHSKSLPQTVPSVGEVTELIKECLKIKGTLNVTISIPNAYDSHQPPVDPPSNPNNQKPTKFEAF